MFDEVQASQLSLLDLIHILHLLWIAVTISVCHLQPFTHLPCACSLSNTKEILQTLTTPLPLFLNKAEKDYNPPNHPNA